MCGGSGIETCTECGHESDCDVCQGTGERICRIPCEKCGGSGKIPTPVIVAGRKIDGLIAKSILELGAAEFYDDGVEPDTMLAFRASGGLEGRVMPMTNQ
jgi:hypothetical protein